MVASATIEDLPTPFSRNFPSLTSKEKFLIIVPRSTTPSVLPRELGFSEGEKVAASQVKVIVEHLNEGNMYFTSVPKIKCSRKIYIRRLTAMREAGYQLLFKGYRGKMLHWLTSSYSIKSITSFTSC